MPRVGATAAAVAAGENTMLRFRPRRRGPGGVTRISFVN